MPDQNDKTPTPPPAPQPEPEPIIVVVPEIERVEYGEQIGDSVTIEIDSIEIKTGLE